MSTNYGVDDIIHYRPKKNHDIFLNFFQIKNTQQSKQFRNKLNTQAYKRNFEEKI